MSILAPSRGGKIDTQDFGLYQESQRSGSSVLCRGRWLREAEKAGVTYNDFMTEWFSTMKGNEGLGFVHAFPGEFHFCLCLEVYPLFPSISLAPEFSF